MGQIDPPPPREKAGDSIWDTFWDLWGLGLTGFLKDKMLRSPNMKGHPERGKGASLWGTHTSLEPGLAFTVCFYVLYDFMALNL